MRLALAILLLASPLGRAAEAAPTAATTAATTATTTTATATTGTLEAIVLPAARLAAEAQVDRQGIFLHDLIATATNGPALPPVRLLPSPALGATLSLTRSNLQQLLARSEPAFRVTNWTGADLVRVTRRARTLAEADLKTLLATALQDRVKDRGELEIRITRPWTAIQVPDEAITVRLLDLPANGLNPVVALRFELLAGGDTLGTWQTVFESRIWREVWVARSALRRGQTLADADLARERRDILALREPLADVTPGDASIELTDALISGAPLFQRHLRLRPVVRRGQSADAIFADGTLNLTLRVEVLEDGAPGQIIRIRNTTSRRELRGKVQNDKVVQVCL